MGALSKKLRGVGTDDGGKGFAHWCPGCESVHIVWYKRGPKYAGPTWSYDGNAEAPTCSPSIRNFTTYDEDHKLLPNGQQRTLCHYFLKAGKIEFCGDCPHQLLGKTVELPDWPYAEGTYGGIEE